MPPLRGLPLSHSVVIKLGQDLEINLVADFEGRGHSKMAGGYLRWVRHHGQSLQLLQKASGPFDHPLVLCVSHVHIESEICNWSCLFLVWSAKQGLIS